MKSQPIKLGVYKIICLAVKHHGHALAAQISIMQSLQYYEHLSEPMAECLAVLAKEFDHLKYVVQDRAAVITPGAHAVCLQPHTLIAHRPY